MLVFDSSNEASGCTGYNAKTPTLKTVSLLKKSGKTTKNSYVWKNCNFWGVFLIFSATVHCTEWRFLSCNQCIQTLHLSYQTPPYDEFHFLGLMGFYNFLDPPYREKNVKFYLFLKYFPFSYGIRHTKPPRAEQASE